MVYCDTYKLGLGGVHKDQVMAYASRQLITHEGNYPTQEWELTQ